MKQKKAIALLLGLQLLFSLPVHAADANVLVTINGHVTDWKHPCIMVNGRTYMSADDLADRFHGTAKRTDETIELVLRNKTYKFKLNSKEVAVGDKWITIDQGAIVRGQVVYLPLRWMMDQLETRLEWNGQDKVVTIVAPEGYDSFKLITTKELTEQEMEFVNKVKTEQGIHKLGNLYVIARGASANPGYGLKVEGVEHTWEQVKVYVKLTKPEPGLMYPQVIAYPYLLARVNLPPYTTISFYDAVTKEPLFQKGE